MLCYIIGIAGSGKSYAAHAEAQAYLDANGIEEIPYDLMVPAKKGDPLWFQDYMGESVVIIDDFYGNIDIDTFKRMIDEYPMIVNIKNGSAQFLAKRVYVTSNVSWENWWGADLLANKNNKWAIQRRITLNKIFEHVFMPALHPTTVLGEETQDDDTTNNIMQASQDYDLHRSDAMLVGANTLSELFCTEEQEFLNNCYNGEHI